MDFLDPNKKRAHVIRLYIGYTLVSIAIILGAILLLNVSLGYWVDKKGNVYQNGLVFVSSIPDAAQVNIEGVNNDQNHRLLTNDRINLPAGQYNFEILKQGYRPWQRAIDLRGGSIERLIYPFLFPDNLVTKDVHLYNQNPAFTTISPDHKTILIQEPTQARTFDKYDTTAIDKQPTTLTVPSNVMTVSSRKANVQLVQWSSSNRYVLLQNQLGTKSEFILVDSQNPSQSVNINKRFHLDPVEVTLRDQNQNQVYLRLANKHLLTGNVRAGTTQQILQNVESYTSSGDDMLLYISRTPDVGRNRVGAFLYTNNKSYKVRELPQSSAYLIALSRLSNHWQVAVAATSDKHVYVYRDPIDFISSNNPNRVANVHSLSIDKPSNVSFSPISQFIVAQSGQHFVVYDILTDRQYQYTIKTPFDTHGASTWMDGHRLLASSNGKVIVFDFDGSNYQVLSGITAGTVPFFDKDYSNMYTIAPSISTKNQQALTQTSLRVTPN
jgi:hypothetical protein